ncbi:MAG TPA: LacI family DNA-binding transcriptional regulator [Jatrophihabitans sp.]|jgi:DNA-binding LacI/PurR family transcriptional regulator
MASIEDVARLAGVSIATVSRALRGLPDVAAATRDRVLEAAAELDYVASPFAARLASGRTATVGVVVPFINRWFFAEVIDAIESALRTAGYDLLLYNLGDEEGRGRFFDEMPMRKRVDAIIIASLVLSEDEFEALESLKCPVAVLGLDHPGSLSTRIDDAAGAQVAVEHLLSLGHKRIGLIGGETDDPMRFTPPHHRQLGYRAALQASGLPLDPELEVLGYFTVDGGAEATRTLLRLPEPPTAIFAESDEMAYGALRQLRESGLQVPKDVAVMGFDNHIHSELMDLSTIHQPVAAQARDLTERLLVALSGEEVEAQASVLQTALVVRGSTDPSKSVY